MTTRHCEDNEHDWVLLTTVAYENNVFILSGAFKRRWGKDSIDFCEYIRGCKRCFIVQSRTDGYDWSRVNADHGQSLVDTQLEIQYNIRLRKFMRV